MERSIYVSKDYDELKSKFNITRRWRTDGKYEPFVYIIQEVSTGKLYIGSRYGKDSLESDLGKTYFTSSKIIKWMDDFRSFDIVSLIPCASNHDAIMLEGNLIKETNAVYSDKYLNQAYPNIGFNGGQPEMFTAKDMYGNKFFISKNDERYISGELRGLRKGSSMPESFKELTSKKMKGKVAVKDKNNKCSIVSKDDPRYLDGLLIPVSCGNSPSEETRKKISDSNKGRIVSEESRKKSSEANKGKILSLEHIQIIKDTHTGKVVSEETRRKLSIANKGKKRTLEQNKENRERNLGNNHTQETKNKLSKAFSNMVWINNTGNNKRVLSEDVQAWLNKGWVLGRIKYKHKKERVKVTCPYCNKIGPKSSMIRWHFDNCRSLRA